MFTSKQSLTDAIRKQITSDDNQAIKAMLRIYEYQTDDEQSNNAAIDDNGVGFAGHDAFILTEFCKQYNKKKYLSPKQISIIRHRIGKYARQLVNQAIQKGIYVKKDNKWVIA